MDASILQMCIQLISRCLNSKFNIMLPSRMSSLKAHCDKGICIQGKRRFVMMRKYECKGKGALWRWENMNEKT